MITIQEIIGALVLGFVIATGILCSPEPITKSGEA